MPCISLISPLGAITIMEINGSITSLNWCWSKMQEESDLLRTARDQLNDYFNGQRQDFLLPLAPRGTPFQRRVWNGICDIPYAEVKSYGDLSTKLNTGARAVGTACARNPIPIIIPCHRVVGSNGALTGYSGAGGLASKKKLLVLEGYKFS